MASALAGQTYYDNESTSGLFRSNYYTRTIANDITQDTRSLTWRTKDYLLHDVTNGDFALKSKKVRILASCLLKTQTFPLRAKRGRLSKGILFLRTFFL
jgi:hypothetical protein